MPLRLSGHKAKPCDDHAPMPCVRCGDPAGIAIWKVCAHKDWRVLCEPCDLEANEMQMRFLKVSRPTWRLTRYKATMDRRPVTRHRLIMAGVLPIA